jgi:predicted Zn-dependent protease
MRATCQYLKATYPDLCKVVEEGKFDEAEAALQRVMQVDRGQNLKLVLLYALVLDQNGKPDHARELIENIVSGRPKWADGWQAIALIDEEQGRLSEAIDALKKAAMLVTDKQTEGVIRHRISELMEKQSGAK